MKGEVAFITIVIPPSTCFYTSSSFEFFVKSTTQPLLFFSLLPNLVFLELFVIPVLCFEFCGAVCDSLPNSCQCPQTNSPRLVRPLNLQIYPTMECLAGQSATQTASHAVTKVSSTRFDHNQLSKVRVNYQIYISMDCSPSLTHFFL